MKRSITILFLFVFVCFGCSDENRPNEILSYYKLGTALDSMSFKQGDILYELINDRDIKSSEINIVFKGYAKPSKFIKSKHLLLIIDHGEYAVYLYFDENKKLVDKEIVGS
jgi:hypothetical protein